MRNEGAQASSERGGSGPGSEPHPENHGLSRGNRGPLFSHTGSVSDITNDITAGQKPVPVCPRGDLNPHALYGH